MNIILIMLGTISLGIGILGIVVPGLPTTPFLLLTAGLYLRSSKKLYSAVLNNKFLGPYIKSYQRQHGMTRSMKISSIVLMWVMILISALFLISSLEVIVAVVGLGVVGTLVMGWFIPTADNDQDQNNSV